MGSDPGVGGDIGSQTFRGTGREKPRIFPAAATAIESDTFPGAVSFSYQTAGAGRVYGQDAGWRCARSLRTGRRELFAFDCPESPLLGPAHATTIEGGVCGEKGTVFR